MIEYPAGLPAFIRTDHGLSTVDPQQRSELESGRSRVRRKFTQTPTFVAASVLMNPEEAALFESWWEHALVSGTKWFQCPLDTPMGYQEYTARFAGIYDGPRAWAAEMWRFTFTLELRKRPLLPPPWAGSAPDFILNMSRFDVLMNKTWPEAHDGDAP